MKTCWGCGGTAPQINLGTWWKWVINFMPWALCSWYPLNRKLGGSQSQSGHSGEKKQTLHCSCQESNPSCPAHTLVTILNELLLLSYKSISQLKLTKISIWVIKTNPLVLELEGSAPIILKLTNKLDLQLVHFKPYY